MSESGDPLRIPYGRSDVTEKWLSKVLNIPVDKDTLKILKWTEDIPNTFKDSLFRLQFQSTQTDGQVVQRNLIAKLLPRNAEPCHSDPHLVITKQGHMKEVTFYRDMLTPLVNTLPDLSPFLCSFVYGDIQKGEELGNGHGSVLLLEDLMLTHYQPVPFHQQMDYGHFDQGIVFLAKFHFATKAIERHAGKALPEMYPWLPKWQCPPEEEAETLTNKDNVLVQSQESFQQGLDTLETFLPETHRNAFVDLKRNAKKIFRLVVNGGQEFPTGIHGSLWQNNILVQKLNSASNSNGQDEEDKRQVKIMDWQMVAYADPLFDLAIYILSCFPEEHLSIMSVELTVLRYTDEFNKLLKEAEKPEKTETDVKMKVRTDFHENLQFFNTYGLAYAFIWFTINSATILKVKANEDRLVNLFKFLHDDIDLPAFLYSIL